MYNPFAKPFEFSILGEPALSEDLQVLGFKGTEHISQPYSFEVQLISERPDLPLTELMHKPAFLTFDT